MDHIFVSFEPDKMEKVFYNLMSNAFKFTPENGRITVTLGVEHNELAVIRVRDTGIGISEERLPHIFDRFYQVDEQVPVYMKARGLGWR
jgi:signal transduction histidine kinase